MHPAIAIAFPRGPLPLLFYHQESPIVVDYDPPCIQRTIRHYSSLQDILLVGEGDFSFSLALARAFGSAWNMVATSRDSKEKLLSQYPSAHFTLPALERLGAILIHGVDATTMAAHELFRESRFDCIVYNFPHAGFFGPENKAPVIEKHKELVRLFFQNAAKLLKQSGEIHVSHKVKRPYTKWNLVEEAFKSGLVLRDCCDFDQRDYPGYVNRRGDGADSAHTFHLGECKTFKFVLNPSHAKPARSLGLRKLFTKGVKAIRGLLRKRFVRDEGPCVQDFRSVLKRPRQLQFYGNEPERMQQRMELDTRYHHFHHFHPYSELVSRRRMPMGKPVIWVLRSDVGIEGSHFMKNGRYAFPIDEERPLKKQRHDYGTLLPN